MSSARWTRQWLPAATALVVGLSCWFFYRARRRMDYPEITMAQAQRHMKTGDLILFSGRYIPLTADVSSMVQRALFLGSTYIYRALDASEWGHVGVVYRRSSDQALFLLHSELDGRPDALAGQCVVGVQMTPLLDKLQSYHGYCVWRPINREIPETQVIDFLRLTYPMHYRIPGDVWMRFVDRLLKAKNRRRSPLVGSTHQTQSGMFCSEWVGVFFEYCRVFDPDLAPYNSYYLPSDFSYKGTNRYLVHPYRFDTVGWELDLAPSVA